MRGRWITLVAVALAAMLAACGGDDDSSDADESGPTEAADEEPEGEPEPEPEAEPAEPQSQTYEVQSGDTLSSIAERFDVTVEDLIEGNDLEDPDVLFPGDELLIP